MTASMTVPLQSSQALHRLVGPSAGGAGRRRGARQRTSDSVLRDQEHRRGGREILSEEETKHSLFDVESSPGSSTVHHRFAWHWHHLSFLMSGCTISATTKTPRKLPASGDCLEQ